MLPIVDFRLKTILFVIFAGFPFWVNAWIPTGEELFHLTPECQPDLLRKNITAHFGRGRDLDGTREWADLEREIQNYFDKCSDQLEDGNFSRLIDYAEVDFMEYDYQNSSNFREVSFSLAPEGIIHKGYLGLKPGKEKRPLVIFECGLSCDPGDPAMRMVAMMFYDMGPFHVLLLPSNSGKSFVGDNKIFAVGGLQEGKQIVRVSQIIKSGNWKYSNRISRIHLFGMSLGGHAAYYASAYADYLERDKEQGKLFSTVAVGCPVVNLKQSMEHVTSETFIAKLLRRTILANIVSFLSEVRFFDPWFAGKDRSYHPTQKELREMLESGTYDYYKKRIQNPLWATPPFDNIESDSKEVVWNNLNFSKNGYSKLRSPVFSWAPEDDDIVLYEPNSKILYRLDEEKSISQRRIFKLKTKKGGHCAFPVRFGWQASSTLFNSLFLARSPELLKRQHYRKVAIPRNLFTSKHRASSRRWRVWSRWAAIKGKDYVQLSSEFLIRPCRNVRQPSIHRCREYVDLKIPLRTLGLSNRAYPKSDTDAQSLTRWLNARLIMETSSFEPMGAKNNPSYFSILEYN